VSRSCQSRIAILAVLLTSSTFPPLSRAIDTAVLPSQPAAPSNIVIGFVGGFVRHNNPHHGPVQIANHIRKTAQPGTYIQVFENRRRRQARETVLRLLDANHDGVLSPQEKQRARIVLFGQSWGAAAAVSLARDLRREGIPVQLTVQVDSVAKLWQNDSIIPDNVVEAVNFYQTQGIIHGRRRITAADPAKTEILGNYLMDYRKNPASCTEYPFWDRVLTPGHMQSECDTHLWSQIETLVEQNLSLTTNAAALSSKNDSESSR
jgi:hypothetical protein